MTLYLPREPARGLCWSTILNGTHQLLPAKVVLDLHIGLKSQKYFAPLFRLASLVLLLIWRLSPTCFAPLFNSTALDDALHPCVALDSSPWASFLRALHLSSTQLYPMRAMHPRSTSLYPIRVAPTFDPALNGCSLLCALLCPQCGEPMPWRKCCRAERFRTFFAPSNVPTPLSSCY